MNELSIHRWHQFPCRPRQSEPAANNTWQNIKTFISAEHAKENKQNKLTAKNFKANMIEEQAEVTEELIAALTEKHTQQIENLIKSNTEAMKQMMSLIKNDKKEPGDKQQPDEEKKKKREERQQRFNDAPICKHCGKKHPTKKEDECWELEANKASRPVNWKSSKST